MVMQQLTYRSNIKAGLHICKKKYRLTVGAIIKAGAEIMVCKVLCKKKIFLESLRALAFREPASPPSQPTAPYSFNCSFVNAAVQMIFTTKFFCDTPFNKTSGICAVRHGS
jgi:hypothetical protein